MPRPALSLLLAAGIGLAAAGASAAPDPTAETSSVHVRVADLNLSSETDARVALRRITRAADTVCGDEAGTRDLQRRAAFDSCVRGVVDSTVASSRSPVLAEVSGRPIEATNLAAAN
jgi:UrcA family protein